MNVKWTDWATAQLEAIEEFVARDNAGAAEQLVEKIIGKVGTASCAKKILRSCRGIQCEG